jgi:hypothetical protein
MSIRPLPRAAVIGLSTTLLPCGWLYAFVVAGGATADPWTGALTMILFWAGTLPVLVALGIGVQRLAGVLAPRLPVITAIALVLVGLFTLFARVQIDTSAFARVAPHADTIEASVEQIQQAGHASLPCCANDEH